MKTFPLILALALPAMAAAQNAPAAKPGKVLVVMSSADHLTLKNGKKHPTGFFMVELTGPAQAMAAAGYELVFADPRGNAPAMDKTSDSAQWYKNQEEYQRAKAFVAGQQGLKQPRKLSSLTKKELAGFSAVFVPGGHAPMEDLWRDAGMKRVLQYFHKAGKTTALICHGPAALLSVAGKDKWIYDGYKMTVFSTPEEQQNETSAALGGKVKFYPADRLAAAGGKVDNAAPWTSHAVRDRELITGQNPMSEAEFTTLLLKALRGESMRPKTRVVVE
jgi:putative intracellular protease/amidase